MLFISDAMEQICAFSCKKSRLSKYATGCTDKDPDHFIMTIRKSEGYRYSRPLSQRAVQCNVRMMKLGNMFDDR